MTPTEFKAWRHRLNLDQGQAAHLLGYKHGNAVSMFESGKRLITPRIALACELLELKHPPSTAANR